MLILNRTKLLATPLVEINSIGFIEPKYNLCHRISDAQMYFEYYSGNIYFIIEERWLQQLKEVVLYEFLYAIPVLSKGSTFVTAKRSIFASTAGVPHSELLVPTIEILVQGIHNQPTIMRK